MPSTALVIATAFLIGHSAQAATLLTAGQTGYGEFTTMHESSGSAGAWTIAYSDRLMQGSSYRLRVYELSVLGVPVFDQTIYGSATGQSGIFFIGMDQQGYFPDFQGTFRIDMMSGTVGIDYVHFVTEIDGIDYTTVVSSLTVVPEPTSPGLGILAGLVAVSRRRARILSPGA